MEFGRKTEWVAYQAISEQQEALLTRQGSAGPTNQSTLACRPRYLSLADWTQITPPTQDYLRIREWPIYKINFLYLPK